MAQPPLLLLIEFARTEQGDEPFGFRFDSQEYLVRSEGGAFKTARFAWDAQLRAELDALRQPGRDPALLARIGQVLRSSLETTKWPQDEVRLLDAVREGRRVLVSIRSAAAELYALPWELLLIESTGQHIGELPGVLVRYEWPDTRSLAEAPPPAESPRLLCAWSTAGGAVPSEDHITAIEGSQPGSASPFERRRDVLSHASMGRLSSALTSATQAGRPIAILHLLAHGRPTGSTFGIVLDGEDADGGPVVVDAGRLRQLLAPHAATLRLVVLSACDSGNSGALGNQLGSLAQALHRAGIAAVVGSRYPLSVSGSIRLCQALYPALLSGQASLETALLAARLQLARDAAQLDWASLQLYARAADGAETHPITPPSRAGSDGAVVRADGVSRSLSRAPRFILAAASVVLLAGGVRFVGAHWARRSNEAASPPPATVGREPALSGGKAPAASVATQSEPAKTVASVPPAPVADLGAAASVKAEVSPAPVGEPATARRAPAPDQRVLSTQKAPVFRGVILDMVTKDPIAKVVVSLIGTRCRTRTDEFGVFDFSSCRDEAKFFLKHPQVRLDASKMKNPEGGRTICNDISLLPGSQDLTRIDLGKHCKIDMRELIPD